MALRFGLLLVAALLLVNATAMASGNTVSAEKRGKAPPLAEAPEKHDHDHDHDHQHHHHHTAPKKAPTPPHSTEKMVHAPPPHHHSEPPMSPPAHGCEAMCSEHCKTHHPKTACMKDCTACCDKAKCVPSAKSSCKPWDYVTLHGQKIKCP